MVAGASLTSNSTRQLDPVELPSREPLAEQLPAGRLSPLLADFPADAIQRLSGLKVLAVDDFPLDLEAAGLKLRALGDLGGEVHLCGNPKQAVDMITAAAGTDRPYDLLCLDCAMRRYEPDGSVSGINGDEFLKRIAAELPPDLPVPPAFFLSGSHASGVQSFVYSEVERLRRRDSRLADEHVDQVIGGVPLTLVLKTAPARDVLEACNQVLRINQGIQSTEYRRYIAEELRVSHAEQDIRTQQIAHMARIGHLWREALESALNSFDERFPEHGEEPLIKSFRNYAVRLGHKEFEFELMLGGDVAARSARHSLPGLFGGLVAHAALTMDSIRMGRCAVPSDKEDADEFLAWAVGLDGVFQRLLTEYHFYCTRPVDTRIELSLNRVARSVLDQHRLHEKAIQALLPAGELRTIGLRDTLEHLLAQPIANALKFTDPQSAEITVTLETAPIESVPSAYRVPLQEAPILDKRLDRERAAHFMVRDNGGGIAPENLERIFDEGFSTVSNHGRSSSGLGLAMLRQNLQSFRGVCFAESTLGVGTVIHVYLPLVRE